MNAPGASTRGVARVGATRAIGLVAGRELRTRLSSRAFLWTTAVIVVAIVVGGFVISTLASRETEPRQVGVTAEAAAAGSAFQGAAAATGTEVALRTVTADEGEDLLRAGELHALLIGPADKPVVVAKTDLDPRLSLAIPVLAQQLALDREISDLGGDPVAVGRALAAAAIEVRSLEQPPKLDESRGVAGLIGGILIYMALVITGQLVAQGVVEEKTSRVVELLLATMRPWQLMAGKILGIGAFGLIQLLLVAGAGVATAAATGALAGTQIDLTATFLWVLVWFLLGYAMYSVVLAALAALVSRQEDVGTVITPVILVMVIPYMVGVTVGVQDPTNPLVVNLSMVPFFSPFLMPIRISTGTVGPWELVLSLALTLAVIPALVWLAGKIYGNAVLRTGARVSLRAALRRG